MELFQFAGMRAVRCRYREGVLLARNRVGTDNLLEFNYET